MTYRDTKEDGIYEIAEDRQERILLRQIDSGYPIAPVIAITKEDFTKDFEPINN